MKRRRCAGVKGIVREDEWVAVVADNWWRANEAAKKLKIEWDNGKNGSASDATILAMFREGLDDPKIASARKVGDAPAALQAAAKVVEAEYYSPYLNHATMEPMTATAWWKDDGTLEVWTLDAERRGAHRRGLRDVGLSTDKVEIHKMMLGGGFGRRGAQEYVRQAVIIAKTFPGKPVKLIWSREEDMQHGLYRPASLVKMKAGLDASGKLVAIHSRIACPSILVGFAPTA
jgi:isoquinoline 1-oxidoreductase beta subunit